MPQNKDLYAEPWTLPKLNYILVMFINTMY